MAVTADYVVFVAHSTVLDQKLPNRLENLGVKSHPNITTIPIGQESSAGSGVKGFIVLALLFSSDSSASHRRDTFG